MLIVGMLPPHRGLALDSLPTDAARARLCAQWANDARNDWYQGQREMVEDVLLSRSLRYRGMKPDARAIIGRRRWANSQKQAELVSAEQMYTRWTQHFVALAQLSRYE